MDALFGKLVTMDLDAGAAVLEGFPPDRHSRRSDAVDAVTRDADDNRLPLAERFERLFVLAMMEERCPGLGECRPALYRVSSLARKEPAITECLLASLDDPGYTAEGRRCAGAALACAAAGELEILHRLVDRLAGLSDRDFARFVLQRLTDGGTINYTKLRDELEVPGLPRWRPRPPAPWQRRRAEQLRQRGQLGDARSPSAADQPNAPPTDAPAPGGEDR